MNKKISSSLPTLVDATLAIEKLRVASEVRKSHLTLQGKKDPDTDELHSKLVDLEDYVNGRIAQPLKDHPAYPWFSKVKGIGKENISKVVGPIRVRSADYLVCPKCHNDYDKTMGLTTCPTCHVALEELPFADSISAVWKFCGRAPEDGKAPRRQKGKKLSYNSQLRSMTWRLGISMLKAGLRQKCNKCGHLFGSQHEECTRCKSNEFHQVATSKFSATYLKEKEKYYQRFTNEGIKIIPTPQERICPECGIEVKKKATKYCPACNALLTKKEEPEGVIFEGHLHNLALVKMIKLFLACLWLVWREAEGLPITKPYAIDKLGHNSFISPWEMCDE